MLIVCPACASEYQIEAERVGAGGRSVRCASCRETWFITAEDVATALHAEESGAFEGEPAPAGGLAEPSARTEEGDGAVVDQPMPPPRRRSAAGPAKRPRKPRALSPALVAGLVLFVLAPLALLGRSTVVRAMPQTASLFSAIGLPVNLRGVDLREVVAFQNPAEGGKPAQLVVEGDLVGVARGRVEVPMLEIVVRDGHGQPVYRWTVPPPRAALEAAETARFRASLSTPPAQGRRIEVRFAEPKPAETAQQEGAGSDHHDAAAPAAGSGGDAPHAAKPAH